MEEVTPDTQFTDNEPVDISSLTDRQLAEATLEQLSLLTFIQMKCYDVLLSHYGEDNLSDARALGEQHAAGTLRSPQPM